MMYKVLLPPHLLLLARCVVEGSATGSHSPGLVGALVGPREDLFALVAVEA